jgi:hypothetical protein
MSAEDHIFEDEMESYERTFLEECPRPRPTTKSANEIAIDRSRNLIKPREEFYEC